MLEMLISLSTFTHTLFNSNSLSCSAARSVKITFSFDELPIQFGTLTAELEAVGNWFVVTPKFSSPSGSSRSVEVVSSRCSIEVSVILSMRG